MFADESEYLKLFLEDAEEQLLGLNRSLLAIEKQPGDRAILDELFRSAHNLKGGSATMGFHTMEKLTHRMEDVLGELRNGSLCMTTEMADCLFQCLDKLNRIVELISSGQSDNIDIEEQAQMLQDFIAALPSATPPCMSLTDNTIDDFDSLLDTGDSDAHLAAILNQLSEYDLLVIADEYKQNRKVFEIAAFMSEDTAMRSARAFVMMNNLKEFGDVLKMFPDLNDFDEADTHFSFHFLFSTDETIESIKEKTIDGEVDFIEIIPASALISIEGLMSGTAAEQTAAEEVEEQIIPESAPQYSIDEIVRPTPDMPSSAPVAEQIAPIAAPAPPAQQEAIQKRVTMSTIRVDTDRLDALMNLVGELVINRTRFAQVRHELAAIEDELSENEAGHAVSQHFKNLKSEFDIATQQMGRIANELQTRVMQTRMLPVSNVFTRFERVVRDIARQSDLHVELVITGQDTELDKTVIEVIGDPLMHIIRNAIAHGIELPHEREIAGKPASGRIDLRAYHEGNHVIIEVEDDGRGIDPEKIKEVAVRKGILTREHADKMTDREAVNIIFMPAFSTTEEADEMSGRGVGMDVVARNIDKLNGMVDVQTVKGKGTKFIIRIPLTLATIQALLVEVGGEILAIPLVNILEAVRIRPEEIESIEGREVTLIRGKVLSLLNLDRVLGLPGNNNTQSRFIYIVVVGLADKRVGLVVHSLHGQQEIVIKSIGEYFSELPAIAGASILGDGRVSLILDVYSLIDIGVRHVNEEVTARQNSHNDAAAKS